MSEEAFGEGPVGPMILDEAVVVDVADVMPELADPEVVAEIVAPTREIETTVGEPLVELDEVTVQVRRADRAGRGDVQHQPRRDPRPDRAERCRQDHLLQRDDRRLPADVRAR